jgi:hypothetical protein
MRKDMTCRGFQYEIGKEYHVDEDVKLCKSGFHFCKNLQDVFEFYFAFEGNRYFEVEANIVESDGKKCVADKIRIIRELTPEEINRCYYSCGYGDGSGYGYLDDGYGSGEYFGSISNYKGEWSGNFGDWCYCGYGIGYGGSDGDRLGFVRRYNIEKVLKLI